MTPPKSTIIAEDAGQRRKPGQSLDDRLREIKSEKDWLTIDELKRRYGGGE